MSRLNAFTLVELLVVISIIAILAALILPVLAVAKQQGEITVCKNNLRQMGLALNSYTLDFNAYPIGASTAEYPPTLWYNFLQPYTHAQWATNLLFGRADSRSLLYMCPGYARCVGTAELWPPTLGGWQYFGAYGYNCAGTGAGDGYPYGTLGLDGNGFPELTPVPAHEILAPSDMIAIGDADIYPFNFGDAPPQCVVGQIDLQYTYVAENPMLSVYGGGSPIFNMMYSGDRNRHGEGRRNIVFCDGHVECLISNQLFNFTAAAVRQRWNKDHQPHPGTY